jgi:hypothetical protein
MSTLTLPSADLSETPAASIPGVLDKFFSGMPNGQPTAWNWKTAGGLATLVLIWAAWTYGTWENWGWLTADCGREMYVPTVLSEGKTLYRDIWYLYGPLAPYWNGFLFRAFGVHLSVLYWAGSLSALGSALFLYFAGMRMSSALAGWTAGALLLTQSFQHSLFSFPLPYSFASVYGCLTACAFLWLVIRSTQSPSTRWMFAAGIAAAVATLLKLEIGAACYAVLALLLVIRALRHKSWKFAARDIAACLPGIAACVIVLLWMVSLRGAEFITQENIMSWPTSFFMRTYGKFWLATTGLDITGEALFKSVERTFILLGIFQGIHLLFSWRRAHSRQVLLRGALFLGALAFFATYLMSFEQIRDNVKILLWREALRYLFFPQDMVLYVSIAAIAAWWYFWRHRAAAPSAATALTFTLSAVLAVRILLMTTPWGYSIFYDGPAILSALLLAFQVVVQTGRSRRSIILGQSMLCVMCLAAAGVNTKRQYETAFPPTTRLTTERGSIRVSKHLAAQYQAAIQFMKEQNALGEQVLSVPEDTSLYFLSATHCPTRVFTFDPGVVAPGRMTDEVIEQIARKPVRYLIWSNRTYPEYKAMRFGVEFDQTLGHYLLSNYHRVRPLLVDPVPLGEWNAYIWERNQDAGQR